jgi:hypothetical protein
VSESSQTPGPSEQGEADGAAAAPAPEAESTAAPAPEADSPAAPADPPTAVTPAPADPPVGGSPPAYPPPPPEPAPSDSSATPPYTPAGATELAADRPEVALGAAFAGGFVLALILKRLAR